MGKFNLIIIVVVFVFFGSVIFSPFIYTIAKCKGSNKFIGLKYSLMNLFVAVVYALVGGSLEKIFLAMGGRTGNNLANGSNIICFIIWLYASFGIVMKKVIKAVKE